MGRGLVHIGVAALLMAGLFSLPARAGEGCTAADSLRSPALRYLTAPIAEWSGDSLVLSFSCAAEGRFKGAVSLHALPLFISDSDTLSYPEMSFYTPSGAKFLRRRKALSWNSGAAGGRFGVYVPSRLYVVGRENPDSILYREAIAVPSGLKGSLYVIQKVEDCCEQYVLAGRGVSVAVPERGRSLSYPDVPAGPAEDAAPESGDLAPVEPENGAFRSRSLVAALRLNYPVDRWEVYPDFENNSSQLQRLDSLLSPIIYNTDEYKLLRVSITGYASPEGTYIHNLELSGKRADGIRDYLMKRYGLPSSLIVSVNGMGEDWDGLRSAVEESDMPEKAEILSIIDGYGIFEGRELQLLNMRGGQPYRRMLRELFPPLRRVEVKLDYIVISSSRSEAEPGNDKVDGEEEYEE